MKGWRMILLVNGGLFLFMAVSTWGLSGFTSQCGPETDCDPSAGTPGIMRNIATALALVGLVLLVLGATLRRSAAPPQP